MVINNVGNANPYRDILIKPSDFNRSMKINLYSPLYIILVNKKKFEIKI